MKPAKNKLLTASNIAWLAFMVVMGVTVVTSVKSYAHNLGAAMHDIHCIH